MADMSLVKILRRGRLKSRRHSRVHTPFVSSMLTILQIGRGSSPLNTATTAPSSRAVLRVTSSYLIPQHQNPWHPDNPSSSIVVTSTLAVVSLPDVQPYPVVGGGRYYRRYYRRWVRALHPASARGGRRLSARSHKHAAYYGARCLQERNTHYQWLRTRSGRLRYRLGRSIARRRGNFASALGIRGHEHLS